MVCNLCEIYRSDTPSTDPAAQKRVADTAKRIAEWSEGVTDLIKDADAAHQTLVQAAASGDKV